MRLIIGNVSSPANPLLRAVYFIVGFVVLLGALFFGAVLFAIAAGIAVILGAVIAVRVWWIRRKLQQSGPQGGAGQTAYEQARQAADAAFGRARQPGRGPGSTSGPRTSGGQRSRIIEGEFVDVSQTDDKDKSDKHD